MKFFIEIDYPDDWPTATQFRVYAEGPRGIDFQVPVLGIHGSPYHRPTEAEWRDLGRPKDHGEQ